MTAAAATTRLLLFLLLYFFGLLLQLLLLLHFSPYCLESFPLLLLCFQSQNLGVAAPGIDRLSLVDNHVVKVPT